LALNKVSPEVPEKTEAPKDVPEDDKKEKEKEKLFSTEDLTT